MFEEGIFYRVVVRETGLLLAADARAVVSFFSRLKGLLGTESLIQGSALIISPCNSVHTFFMKYPVDVVLIEDGDRIAGIYKNLKPYRMTAIHFNADWVIELPAGSVSGAGLLEGFHVEIARK